MQTLLKQEIAPDTLGILYLCKYTYSPPAIKVIRELQFKTGSEALEAFANIPNPESQMAAGKDREGLLRELERLHRDMADPKWLERLGDCL